MNKLVVILLLLGLVSCKTQKINDNQKAGIKKHIDSQNTIVTISNQEALNLLKTNILSLKKLPVAKTVAKLKSFNEELNKEISILKEQLPNIKESISQNKKRLKKPSIYNSEKETKHVFLVGRAYKARLESNSRLLEVIEKHNDNIVNIVNIYNEINNNYNSIINLINNKNNMADSIVKDSLNKFFKSIKYHQELIKYYEKIDTNYITMIRDYFYLLHSYKYEIDAYKHLRAYKNDDYQQNITSLQKDVASVKKKVELYKTRLFTARNMMNNILKYTKSINFKAKEIKKLLQS